MCIRIQTSNVEECGNDLKEGSAMDNEDEVRRFAHCDVWKEYFRNKDDLVEHIRTVHEGRFGHCDVWKEDFRNKDDLVEDEVGYYWGMILQKIWF